MKRVTLYCDGSSLGNPGPGGYCGILRYGDAEKIIQGGEPMTTNNRMELFAVIASLRQLKEPCEVHIISDSSYVLKGISQWLKGWIARDFAKVKNPDLWREYITVAKPHTITTEWVKGHSGHPENEQCDALAREQAERYKRGA